ncbi:MAG TPA: DUF4147 domain-containing protein, partial [Trueperaceae bacterium]
MREILETAFRRALAGADPAELTGQALPEEQPDLILAVGKAALPMLRAASERFPGVPWLATPPAGPADAGGGGGGGGENGTSDGTSEVLPGSHPLPDETSVRAARRALQLAEALGP